MKRLIVFAFVALLLGGCFCAPRIHAQASASAGSSDFDKPILDYEKQIQGWEREARIEIVLVGAVIVFGALVSLFQKWSTQWAKTATIALGVAITIITAFNSKFFSADYRTLHLAAADGHAITAQLWPMAGMLNDPHTSDEIRKTTQELYFKKLAEFPAIIARLEGTKTATIQTHDGRLFSLPRVYAQYQQQSAPPLPGWVKAPPSDEYSLYFVGKAVDPSLAAAKAKSLDDADSRAVERLKARAPSATEADILALIKPSAIVQDSAFAYDNNAHGFVYYTLLRLAKEIETIGVKSLAVASVPPTIFKRNNWRPGDLALNKSSGLWVLDTDGGVSRLTTDDQHTGRIETLFHLNRSFAGYALTATADSVFVAANSQLGCTVFRYSLPSKATSQRVMAVKERCTGISTDGSAIFLSMGDRKEIRFWSNFTASDAHSWSLPDMDAPGSLTFDDIGHRLIVAGSSGKVYAISIPDGRQQLLASNLGAVTSIAVSRFHVLMASGKKVFFLARSDNRVENPPANLGLTGGHIVGVAVDATEKVWFADYDNQLVEGPFPL